MVLHSFKAFYNYFLIVVTCDSGATSSLIKYDFAKRLDMPIHPTTQLASQADGKTKLTMCGKVHVKLSRGDLQFSLEVVVVQELDCVLAGVPFMRENDIFIGIPKDDIIIKSKHFTKNVVSP